MQRSDELRRLQQEAIRLLWEEVRRLTSEREKTEAREHKRAATVIQRYWRGYMARKVWGPALRNRLLDNLSGVERLRAAVRAGNTTALVELCLHLQDQVDSLNVAMAKVSEPGSWSPTGVPLLSSPR
jgi:hypothetical protein